MSSILFQKSYLNLNLVCLNLLVIGFSSALAITLEGVSSLQIWITVSSLANKDPNNAKSLLFRQIELNWINAPLEDENDYIGLYLDAQPDENVLPVSVHRLSGQTSGQIITDYYLPLIDLLNSTADDVLSSKEELKFMQKQQYSTLGSHRIDIHPPEVHRSRDHLGSNSLVSECVGYCIAFHSRNRIIAQNCLRTNPNWMRDAFNLIGSRSLPTLMLPGTHNSGTYPKQLDKTVLHMINKYQINQDENIFNQLVYGIRHLDLRVGYSKVKQRPERLWIYHDIFRTDTSMEEVFEQVRQFLDMTSHEIVIMDFHRFTVGFQNENLSVQRERHSKLIDLLFRQLGHYIVPSYLGQQASLNEYVSMGKRLIVCYANKGSLVSQSDSNSGPDSMLGLLKSQSSGGKQQVRQQNLKQDLADAMEQTKSSMNKPDSVNKYSIEDSPGIEQEKDQGVGSRLFNKLKSLKLISNSFSKRSSLLPSQSHNFTSRKQSSAINSTSPIKRENYSLGLTRANLNQGEHINDSTAYLKAAIFFPHVRHLWPNKDTVDELAHYMNDTTCRKYFGELRSMMVELTPTVFGAISDKYDGTRKLAQSVNRHVTDWIRDRWLHCINIVASDYFLGNDLIRLSIYANKMRAQRRATHDLSSQDGHCRSFRRIERLLDKSKIPIQFVFQHHSLKSPPPNSEYNLTNISGKDNDIIVHTSSDGNRILLKPLSSGVNAQSGPPERRDSFVENISDGFSSFVSSFKKLLNF